MSSPSKETEEPSSSSVSVPNGAAGDSEAAAEGPRPPAKRPLSNAVIEISDTESDDSDVCAVSSYQASADEVKRIRGKESDYSSSSSSSSDYSSDSESAWEDDSIVLEDNPALSRIVLAQLNPRANRMDDPKLNSSIKSQEVIDQLKTYWTEHKDYSNSDVTLTCEPYRLCLLHGLLDNPEIINNIVDDMNTLDWSRKKMDLYEFHQTADLASLTWQRSIRGIYELLKTEIMTWVSQVTGLTLTNVSASCSLYGPGDHLLVHDDLLGDRRVAFILYLAPWQPNSKHYRRPNVENGAGDHMDVEDDAAGEGWSAHMGGALELLARDAQGRPTDVVHSVVPRNNMLAFFQVGPDSYHQVGEVLSLELPRLSINGWFHGPAPAAEPAPAEPAPEPAPAPPEPRRAHSEPVVITQWIESTYMSPRSRVQVQAQMEAQSEVCLHKLLQEEMYQKVLEALASPDIPWERCGPSNQRRHHRVPNAWAESQPKEHPIRGLLELVSGTNWFRLLADCTDLALNTYVGLELQKWTPGDFTLLPPREQYQEARLEAVMYLGVPARPVCGGSTSYVAPEDPEASEATPGALVTVPPVSNALNLVYCDAGAAGFTKYLSKMTMSQSDCFYILTCTYKE